MATPLTLTFRTSAADPARMPESRAEVAVIGRSNVGKSSVVNAIARHKGLARTSKTPGRTQLLNLFDVAAGGNPRGTMVDLPGYGYAKASKSSRVEWQARMEDYLLSREALIMVIALIDGAVGPTKSDIATVAWMRYHQVPFTPVATKHDKVKASQRGRRRNEVAAALDVGVDEVVWVSAEKGTGMDRLRALTVQWLDEGRRRER